MNQMNPDVTYFENPVRKPIKNLTLQFSIKGILIGLAIVALLIGAIAIPEVFAVLACIAMVIVSAISITSAFCGRGWIQAFAIGYLIPNLLSYLLFFEASRSPEGVLILVLFSTLASIVVGTTAALTHGYLRRRSGKILVPNLPFVRNWFTNE